MNYKTALKILNLDEPFTANQLKKNYYKLSKENHPDLNPNQSNFLDIRDAYDFLSGIKIEPRVIEKPHIITKSSFNIFCDLCGEYFELSRNEIKIEAKKFESNKNLILEKLKTYQRKSLPNDQNLSIPQRKLIDYFISLFFQFFIERNTGSYNYIVIQNIKHAGQFKKIFEIEKRVNFVLQKFFIRFKNKDIKESNRERFITYTNDVIGIFLSLFKEPYYHYNQDIKEYCDNMYFLITTFDKILFLENKYRILSQQERA